MWNISVDLVRCQAVAGVFCMGLNVLLRGCYVVLCGFSVLPKGFVWVLVCFYGLAQVFCVDVV